MAAFLGGKFVANAIVILLVSLVLLVIGCLYFNRPLSVLPLGLFWMTISEGTDSEACLSPPQADRIIKPITKITFLKRVINTGILGPYHREGRSAPA